MRIFRHFIVLVSLVAMSVSCSLSTQTPSPSPEANIIESQPALSDNSFRVSYRNISFVTPPYYSNRIIAEQLELAEQASPDVWPPYFEQIQFGEKWDLAETNGIPSLVLVYPVADLTQTYADGARAVSDLRALLQADQSTPLPQELPFWPLVYYTQVAGAQLASYGRPVLAAHSQYLDFQSGHGVRYLTFLESQPPRLYSTDSLIYTYQGLTSDGGFYVSVMISLFIKDDSTRTGFQSLAAQNPPDYTGILEELSGLTDEQFQPSLGDCDNLVASLVITP
jgi:hypothetical protein